jgi:hypothetical protein
MNYKVLGTVSSTNLLKVIVQEAHRIREVFENKPGVIAPAIKSKAHLAHFQNERLVKVFRDAIFPKNFDTDKISVHNHQLFITPPGDGFEIHKDGSVKKSALNILIQGSELDWTRWYSDELVEVQHGGKVIMATPDNSSGNRYSRNIGNLPNYPSMPYTDQLTGISVGTMYLVNTDVYHAFFNNSNNWRIVLQTNFTGNPSIEQLYDRIQQTGLLNVTPV